MVNSLKLSYPNLSTLLLRLATWRTHDFLLTVGIRCKMLCCKNCPLRKKFIQILGWLFSVKSHDLHKITSFKMKNINATWDKTGNHTHTRTLYLSFAEWSFNSCSLIFSYILALSLGIWRSGEGNARDYGSSATGPFACHERVKLMARRGVGGLQSLCRRPWKRMPFITDWPSQAVAGGLSPDVLDGDLGGSLPGFTVNVPVLMKPLWSTGPLCHAMSECPSSCWSLQVCCGS